MLLCNWCIGEYWMVMLLVVWDDCVLEGEWEEVFEMVFDIGCLFVDMLFVEVWVRVYVGEV